MDNNEETIFLTAKDVSKLAGLKKSTIYALVKRGELPAYQFGKSVKFKQNDIVEYIENNQRGLKHQVSDTDKTILMTEEDFSIYRGNLQNVILHRFIREFPKQILGITKDQPNWIDLIQFKYYEDALNTLRHYLEDNESKIVSGNNLQIIVKFPIKNATWSDEYTALLFHFDNLDQSYLPEKYSGNKGPIPPHSILEITDKLQSMIFNSSKDFMVIQMLTCGIWIVKQLNGNWKVAQDPNIASLLKPMDESARNDLLNSLCKPQKMIGGKINITINNKHLEINVNADIRPIEIDPETDECTIPILAGLIFNNHISLCDLTKIERQEVWRQVFKLIMTKKDQLTTYREQEEWHRIPVNPVLVAVFLAIWKGGEDVSILENGWQENAQGMPIYIHNSKEDKGKISLHLESHHTNEQLWDKIKNFSPFTLDVLLAILSELGNNQYGEKHKYPVLEPLEFNIETLLSHKNFRRDGQEKQAKKEEIKKQLNLLSLFHFDIENWRVINPETWKDDTFFEGTSFPVFYISTIDQDENLWSILPGEWAYYWYNSQSEQVTARLSKQILKSDHRGKALDKKIGLLITSHNEVVSPQLPIIWHIKELLISIGEYPTEEQYRKSHWARRTKESLDEAILALQEQGIFTKVEWPKGYGPDYINLTKGWVSKWLDALISVTPCCTPPKFEIKQNPKVEDASKRIYGGKIRDLRTRRRVNQTDLATLLSITREYLSSIENGKRDISEDLKKKIDRWMEDSSI